MVRHPYGLLKTIADYADGLLSGITGRNPINEGMVREEFQIQAQRNSGFNDDMRKGRRALAELVKAHGGQDTGGLYPAGFFRSIPGVKGMLEQIGTICAEPSQSAPYRGCWMVQDREPGKADCADMHKNGRL